MAPPCAKLSDLSTKLDSSTKLSDPVLDKLDLVLGKLELSVAFDVNPRRHIRDVGVEGVNLGSNLAVVDSGPTSLSSLCLLSCPWGS